MYWESTAANITEGTATYYVPSEEEPNTYYEEVLVKDKQMEPSSD